ncbi:MAG: HAMP domain-containing histidine kinase [Bradyrhizobiaceae bacterium]|nr:MAG: HAMP domain-containing histidine kinase [Bradyrhizobiaceae bacterium]
MNLASRIRQPWPITVKVPIAVAGLMIAVGVLLSEHVLNRLQETQQSFLVDLSQSYLDGLSSAIGPSVLREDNWEVFDAIERAQSSHRSLRPIETVVVNAENRVIAASDPHRHPIGAAFKNSLIDGRFVFDADGASAKVSRLLAYPGRTAGAIFATFDTTHLANERRNVVLALALTNGILTLALALAGWMLMRRMLRPVSILSDHLGAARTERASQIAEPIIANTHGEFRRLFKAYNALVRSLGEREELSRRLAEEKRISSLGRLASAVAHEINNPLGGLFNAVATLKTHGHMEGVRDATLGLLDRGLQAIKDTVRTTLSIYRTDREPRPLEPTDFDDVILLVAPESRRRSVRVNLTRSIEGEIRFPSTPIRQALLNLLLNAIAATPAGGSILVDVTSNGEELMLEVIDGGNGMPDWAIAILTDQKDSLPPLERSGLGLWATSRLVSEMGGCIEVGRAVHGGAIVRIHIARHSRELAHVA